MVLISLTILLKPFFCDETAIADNADTGQLQSFLTITHQLPYKLSLLVDEWLSATEVDLFHA